MPDLRTVSTLLARARALTASEPFDARAAFLLLSTIEGTIRLPAENHLAAALEATLAACDARQGHSMAVARYALRRVAIEIESRAGGRADAVPGFHSGGRSRSTG